MALCMFCCPAVCAVLLPNPSKTHQNPTSTAYGVGRTCGVRGQNQTIRSAEPNTLTLIYLTLLIWNEVLRQDYTNE